MEAHTQDSGLVLIKRIETFACKEYSKFTFIPARNKMIEIVQPAKFHVNLYANYW